MELVAGTSGFSYPEWRGVFYPERLPESAMLRAYAERLPTVEVNNTFYRMPQRSMFQGWAPMVPLGFKFALKVPRRIACVANPEKAKEPMAEFLETARVLGDKLGPLLFQPSLTRKLDEALLAGFLELCPTDAEVAFEFRHPSWFTERVFSRLRERGAALCATDLDTDEGESSPFIRTAPFTYVRLRRSSYDERTLRATLRRIDELGVERAFVYFKHEVQGPSYAEALLRKRQSKRARVRGSPR